MKELKIATFIILCTWAVSGDDLTKSFEKIVKDYGYPFEQHYVTTSDGYILKLFRIPHGKHGLNETAVYVTSNSEYNSGTKVLGSDNGRQSILIQHGIFDSADFVVTHEPEQSPAFFLANNKYDVWVANSRGNKYSRQHKSLNPNKDAKFWDFSFFYMIHDYKTNIEYVRGKTGQKKIAVIGHSQGTSSMFSGLATQNSCFKDRVSIFVALGSVARLDHLTSGLLKFMIEVPIALETIKKLHIYEMFPSNFLTKPVFILLCGTVPTICKFGNALIVDKDPKVDSTEWARIYFGHFPSGSSTKCLEHYSQIYFHFQNYQPFC